MDLVPIELLRRIFQLRTDLCYRTCRDHWKTEWLINISVVNEEYSCNWAWNGWGLYSTHPNDPFKIYNYRDLQFPQSFLFDCFSEKMIIYRCNSSAISKTTRANFPRMYYYYSIRPQFECTDWFLRFLASQ